MLVSAKQQHTVCTCPASRWMSRTEGPHGVTFPSINLSTAFLFFCHTPPPLKAAPTLPNQDTFDRQAFPKGSFCVQSTDGNARFQEEALPPNTQLRKRAHSNINAYLSTMLFL